MPRVFSGIQPTGEPHIGNYFGAMRNYVRLGEEFGKNSLYCVVDLHAITNPAAFDPGTLAQRTFEMAVANFAVIRLLTVAVVNPSCPAVFKPHVYTLPNVETAKL